MATGLCTKWSIVMADGSHAGLWPKVVLPMFSSPVIGFIVAAIVMALLYMALRKATPRLVNGLFGMLQS